VGAARIGMKLGRAALVDTFTAFGLGEKTGVGLPGEARGLVPVPRSELDVATQSFGHHLMATPLQIATAFAAVANGGTLLRPHLVKRVVDPNGGEVLEEARPEVVRRAVSPATAATISRWLVGVVEDPEGTGRRARLEGFRVAGKTGTARKVDPVSGGYVTDRHRSSFVGFAPAESPRVVVGVWLDEPRGEVNGGEVAAPEPAPGGDAQAEGEPPPVEAVADEAAHSGDAGVTVPSLAGLPARTAIRNLESVKLAAELSGAGRVVSQEPPAGRVVARGTRVRMKLAPSG
jgi:cell division protein FtsI (penicillin-binding protein 3)